MVSDLLGNLFVSFSLVADVDQAMVHTHLEFRGGLVAAALVFVELFQTGERYS